MKRKTRFLIGVPLLLFSGGGTLLFVPWVYFDLSRPAQPRDIEWVNGKPAAWGPRPRVDGLFPDWWHPGYTGEEWAFQHYREFCQEWVRQNGYGYPGD